LRRRQRILRSLGPPFQHPNTLRIQVEVDPVLGLRAAEPRKLEHIVRSLGQVALVQRPRHTARRKRRRVARRHADIVDGETAVVRVALEDNGGFGSDRRDVDLGGKPGGERRSRRQLQVAELDAPQGSHRPVHKLTLHLDVGGVGGGGHEPELEADGDVGAHGGRDEPGLGLDVDGVEVGVSAGVQAEGVVLEAAKVLGFVCQLPVLGPEVQGAPRVDRLPAAQAVFKGAVPAVHSGLRKTWTYVS